MNECLRAFAYEELFLKVLLSFLELLQVLELKLEINAPESLFDLSQVVQTLDVPLPFNVLVLLDEIVFAEKLIFKR